MHLLDKQFGDFLSNPWRVLLGMFFCLPGLVGCSTSIKLSASNTTTNTGGQGGNEKLIIDTVTPTSHEVEYSIYEEGVLVYKRVSSYVFTGPNNLLVAQINYTTSSGEEDPFPSTEVIQKKYDGNSRLIESTSLAPEGIKKVYTYQNGNLTKEKTYIGTTPETYTTFEYPDANHILIKRRHNGAWFIGKTENDWVLTSKKNYDISTKTLVTRRSSTFSENRDTEKVPVPVLDVVETRVYAFMERNNYYSTDPSKPITTAGLKSNGLIQNTVEIKDGFLVQKEPNGTEYKFKIKRITGPLPSDLHYEIIIPQYNYVYEYTNGSHNSYSGISTLTTTLNAAGNSLSEIFKNVDTAVGSGEAQTRTSHSSNTFEYDPSGLLIQKCLMETFSGNETYRSELRYRYDR